MSNTLNLTGQDLENQITSLTKTPRLAMVLGWLMTIAFLIMPVALLFIPWQQTVKGRGQIVAYAPTERKQVITARVTGQLTKWHVVEG